jgi:TRAP-type C4-dicarboxylate transport system permease large subunit
MEYLVSYGPYVAYAVTVMAWYAVLRNTQPKFEKGWEKFGDQTACAIIALIWPVLLLYRLTGRFAQKVMEL